MEKKFDVVIWGATGFTGQYVAEYLIKKENISLGLAGRNEKKLTSLKNHLMTLDSKAKNIELIITIPTNNPFLKSLILFYLLLVLILNVFLVCEREESF